MKMNVASKLMRKLSSRHLRFAYSLLRFIAPTLRFRNIIILSRYDHVKEVLNNGHLYRAPYQENLRTVTGGNVDFILGMDPGAAYDTQRKILMDLVRPKDITDLLPDRACAEMIKLIGNGSDIELVAVVRRATSKTLLSYFGMGNDLSDEILSEYEDIALKVFRYQFMEDGTDVEKKKVARSQGQRLSALIKEQVHLAKQSTLSDDNLLGRYLTAAEGNQALSDELIETALFGFIVGGLPQPVMVIPNAVNELLLRPDALKMAMGAATTDDAQLQAIFFEALRFDPLAPMLKRIVVKDTVLAAGTSQEKKLLEGSQIYVMIASAMQDHRRVSRPGCFIPNRPKAAYIHFGFGHHECFAAAINRKMLPAMVKSLLLRSALKRVDGKMGCLVKSELVFPESLYLNVA